MSSESFTAAYDSLKTRVEAALTTSLEAQEWPVALHDAVSYSLMAGGKRLRPILVLVGCDVCGGDLNQALSAACAIEMVHTYSLIHDDLPSMDDDDLRRGRPTNHMVFGEALAILAGDALLTLAFETLGAASLPDRAAVDCLRILGAAAGGSGMVGGQILDLEAERGDFPGLNGENRCGMRQKTSAGQQEFAVFEEESQATNANPASGNGTLHVEQLVRIHKMKTGALITAALQMGAACAGASSQQQAQLRIFGQCTGLAFQIADDLLDVTGSNERLGKETGRDNELGKLTYPSLIGIEASRQKAETLVSRACAALEDFDHRADFLRQLARFIVERDH